MQRDKLTFDTLSIKADDCYGFRNIPYQVFDDRDLFMIVKFATRYHLLTVQEKYKELLSLFDELGKIITFGISKQAGRDDWK
ncbi:hypothetical protein [Parasitella parasitica]|uniref:Uncharacterized protein n=1 Tax=Parasitella parasitica TaxID=35722 RepID=A0A0B7N0D6_9FUNG|nr:hypothetical protein [Parasitella parasitica]